MINKLTKNTFVSASLCNHNGTLGIDDVFDLFMDMANDHGEIMNVGSKTLDEAGLFWIVSRSRLKIHSLPAMRETFDMTTWPAKPERIRCMRYYEGKMNGNVLFEGKTEWAILSRETGRPCRAQDIYPADLEHETAVLLPEPFRHIADNFEEFDRETCHTVRYTDIDIAHHMNNVAYVRAILGSFTCAELDALGVSEFEISYTQQCFEGDKLSIRMKNADGGIIGKVFTPSGAAAVSFFIGCNGKI